MKNLNKEKKISIYSKKIVGPVMFSYVEWIIDQAKKRNIDRLYFLARDGFLLYEIAKRICKAREIDIDCRYLYCSRQSLRMPSYHIIAEEAYDLLLLNGYYVTPLAILKRAMLNESEINAICNDLNITDIDKILSTTELTTFRKKIKNNEIYKKAVLERSRAAYGPTIEIPL